MAWSRGYTAAWLPAPGLDAGAGAYAVPTVSPVPGR
ncbi:hypothetical protein CLV67_10315 [Actinoplanes italicus]|uniref:Uncharacterized protein n=1 Tax=Actinoplanes italicus TaxID=113567 RepID=A0A2T0KIB8_9ACTN|nr:hypothetical protein CLV67_10315 [Actinoplanes italicus]